MKVRMKRVEDTYLYTWWVDFDDGHRSTGETSLLYLESLDDISYTEGYRNYNYCNHNHWKITPTVGLQTGRFQFANGVTNSFTMYPVLPSDVMALTESTLGFNEAAFMQRAVAAVTPNMETGFSAPNFLIEIGEVKGLSRWWDRGKGVFRNFSNDSLQYSFGLIPFISDVRALYEGMSTLQERLAALKKGAGQKHVRYYSERLSDSMVRDRVVPGYITGYVHENYTVEARYTAYIEYTYQFPKIDEASAVLRGFMDSIGAHIDAYTVWEAIPFSFVVDWFFNVGDFLKQFRKEWIDIHIQVLRSGISRKWIVNGNADASRKVAGAPEMSTLVANWVCDFTHYRRRLMPVNDDWFWPTSDGNLTLRKIFLGGLLFEQRVHR